MPSVLLSDLSLDGGGPHSLSSNLTPTAQEAADDHLTMWIPMNHVEDLDGFLDAWLKPSLVPLLYLYLSLCLSLPLTNKKINK